MPEPGVPEHPTDPTAALIAELTARRMTIAVAESLTGGLLTAELIRIPGASAVVTGGIVAYNTEIKKSLLGVDSSVLNVHGAVHPDVAVQMAVGVRAALAVRGVRAAVGVATTGAAGPDPQDGQEPGTVFIGVSRGSAAWSVPLVLEGDRQSVREQTVARAIEAVRELIARDDVE